MAYIIGNPNNDVKEIMKVLDIDISKAKSIDDYIPIKDEIPIMISGSGGYHGDTLTLSDKLHKADIPVDIKIIFDRHADSAYYAREVLPGIDAVKHTFKVYVQGYLKELYVLGIESKVQAEQLEMAEYEHGHKTETILEYSPDISKSLRVKNKKIHISVDIDVIPDLICLGGHYSGTSGPSTNLLMGIIAETIRNNELAAFDIVGYSPEDLSRTVPGKKDLEGISIYKKILDCAIKH